MVLTAEDSARSAADEILRGIPHPDERVRATFETGPHTPAVLGELARIVDSGVVTRPVAPAGESLGLARHTCWLPVRPPDRP